MMPFCTTVSYHPRQPDASNIPAKDLPLFAGELCNIMPFAARKNASPRQKGRGRPIWTGDSAFAGAAVALFKDQIVQIGFWIVTAVHGFTFFPKCCLTVYALAGKKSDVFS